MKLEYTKRGSVSVLGVIQIIFIILKLTNLVDWSWAKVLIPLWIELAFIALVSVFLTVYYFTKNK